MKHQTDYSKYIVNPSIDIAFKKIFTNEVNLWYLAFVIHYVTGMEEEYLEKHIKLRQTFQGTSNMNARTGNGDIIVDIENCMINIEMNKKVTKETILKNNWFLRNMANSYKNKNEKFYHDEKQYIQINISLEPRIIEHPKLIYTIIPMEKELMIEDKYNNVITYDINLEYLKQELYNKDKLKKEEKRFLIFIEHEKKRLLEEYEGDRKMKELVHHISELQDDEDFIIEYDHEAYQRNVYECALLETEERIKKEVTEDVTKKVTEKVSKKKAIEVAKKLLLLKKFDDEEIIDISGLSKEEFINLKKENGF